MAIAALQEIYMRNLGEKMKSFENVIEQTINPNQLFLIRLDGVSFHTFLKGVVKPFDHRITDAMVKTTADLTFKFNAVLGYTSSDEISLVFPALEQTKVPKSHPFNGRYQKLCSVTAGYASARFNHHLQANQWEKDLEKMTSGTAYFDSRVCAFTSPNDVTDCIYWRSNFDAFRNAISQISIFHLKHKGTMGKSVSVLIEELKERNVDVLKDFHARYLFGTWVKRQQLLMDKVNPKTNEPVKVLRSRLCCGSFNWSEWTEEQRIEFTMNKFWVPNSDLKHPPIDKEYTDMIQ